ncbi:type IV toxin-antitoxin system AbiEi family antitoxin domain-containing protein [Modestobacter versicolor]|uniref:type IV toxin-antitoxin system AbiEi family antitoxin domain-containing protein n=1 Tax=Modestobacter versicolor TaxID=429133 RepID=UPI0034E03915
MPVPPPGPVRASAASRAGLFTTAELTAAGVTEKEVRTAVRSGHWVRLRRGLFVTMEDLARTEASGRRRELDALVVSTALDRAGAALSHGTAAWLWGLPVPRDLPRDVRLTDPDRWRSGPGYVMTRAALPEPEVTTLRGHRLTTPARTLVDAAREWSELAAVAALDAALLRGLVTPEELAATLARHRSTPRVPRAARAVAAADGRSESWLETKGRLRFRAAGLPPFVPQVELRVDGRLVKVADGWYQEAALVVEFDGRVKYERPAYGGRPEDVLFDEERREDLLRSIGVRFVRLVDDDLGRGWPPVESRVRRELAVPGPVDRSFTAVPRDVGRVRAAARQTLSRPAVRRAAP